MIRDININDIDSYNSLGLELNSDFTHLFDLSKALSNKYNKIYVYEENNVILGFIHLIISFDSADIINIIVRKDKRGLGIGKKLVDYSIINNKLRELNIEVRCSNDALFFYKKLGFNIIRTIPNYYKGEDAYFMKKVI